MVSRISCGFAAICQLFELEYEGEVEPQSVCISDMQILD